MRYFNFFCILVLLLSTTLSIYGRVFEKEEDCMIHENETIHEIMDRICEMCHEFASHSKPNMRFECRSQCFTTETFRTCLKLFTPKRHTRHNRRY